MSKVTQQLKSRDGLVSGPLAPSNTALTMRKAFPLRSGHQPHCCYPKGMGSGLQLPGHVFFRRGSRLPHRWPHHPYPPGYNHGYRLNEAFACNQLVEAEDLAGGDVEASLWHDTCGQMAKEGSEVLAGLGSQGPRVRGEARVHTWA